MMDLIFVQALYLVLHKSFSKTAPQWLVFQLVVKQLICFMPHVKLLNLFLILSTQTFIRWYKKTNSPQYFLRK